MSDFLSSTLGRRNFLRLSAYASATFGFSLSPISHAVAQAVKEIEPFVWNA